MTQRSMRIVAAVLVGLLLASATAIPARSDDTVTATTTAGTITLTAAAPTTITRSTTAITLAGGLSNISPALWKNVRLDVRTTGTLLTARASLTQWADSAPERNTSEADLVLGGTDIGTVARNGTRRWQVSIPASALTSLRSRDGVLPLELIARTGAGTVVAQLRTAMPVLISSGGLTPTPVVVMLPLTWAPDRIASGRFLSNQLLVDVSAEGRLSQALDVGARGTLVTPPVQVTYLVDAALLDAIADLADGAMITDNGAWRDLTEDERARAAAWLTRATTVLSQHDVFALPYGVADIDALLRQDQRVYVLSALERGAREVAQFLARLDVPTAVWLGSSAQRSTLTTLTSAGVSTVVVPTSAVPPTTEPFYTPSGSTELTTDAGTSLRATLIDDTLSSRWQRAATSGVSVNADLSLLSDLLLTTVQLPTTARTQVMALPLVTDTDSGVVDIVSTLSDATAFATTVPLTRVLAQPAGSTARRELSERPNDDDPLLTSRYVSELREARARMRVVLSIASDPEQAQAISDGVLAGLDSAASLTLRQRGKARVALLTGIAEVLTSWETGVSVVSGRRLALSGERGVIPLTVRNDLPFSVRVQLRLTPSSPARFVVEAPPAPLVVQPGERASVQIPVQVLGTDPVTVTASLITPSGVAIGVPATIDVRTAAYARVATYVVAGAFVLLLLLIVRNAVRRRRRARESVTG